MVERLAMFGSVGVRLDRLGHSGSAKESQEMKCERWDDDNLDALGVKVESVEGIFLEMRRVDAQWIRMTHGPTNY
jgi:hypothetical protein